jgi:hypothetical protein
MSVKMGGFLFFPIILVGIPLGYPQGKKEGRYLKR